MPSLTSLDDYKIFAYQIPVTVGKAVEVYDIRLSEGNNLWVKLDIGDFITFTADGIRKGDDGSRITSAFGGLCLSVGPTDWFQLVEAQAGYTYRLTLRVTNRGTYPMKFSAGIDCGQIT